MKATDVQISEYENSKEIPDTDIAAREDVFSRSRPAISQMIRNIEKVSNQADEEGPTDEVSGGEVENERVYTRNRPAISKEMLTSGKVMRRVVRGFFATRDHLHNQFLWVSDIGEKDLRTRIVENWDVELSKMLKFVKSHGTDQQKKKNKAKLIKIEEEVQTEYNGVRTYKDIHILIMAGEAIDKDNEFLVLPDKNIQTSQPFLQVRELPDR